MPVNQMIDCIKLLHISSNINLSNHIFYFQLMRKASQSRDIELGDIRKPNQPYNEQRPRTSSLAAIQYQRLKQMQQNEVAADKSRKSSRISKGLNPDAPKARKIYTGMILSDHRKT